MMSRKTDLPNRLAVLIGVSFPALVYFGRNAIPPQILALLLILLVWVRRTWVFGLRSSGWLVAGSLLLAILAFGLNAYLPLKLYPVMVNGSLLVMFAVSLRYPPTIAERMARIRYPDLPKPLVAYTRRVTQAWCLFFGGNALVALWTAVLASDRVWFYYNGIIAYVLAGVMFAGEWFTRRRALKGISRPGGSESGGTER
jgi:uncharacterized membrane protein